MSRFFVFLIAVLACHQFAIAGIFNVPPEANYDFPEYITSLNHPYEQHTVTTDDGYILTYFRIQKQFSQIQSGLPVIFLHHGLLDSADSFIINDEDQAPGLLLANHGYDIWLGNSRGNKYGIGHVDPAHYNSSDSNSAFWDFSWQEMSEYDIPAGMKYISQYTGQQKINYMGHSQGTTIMWAALARRDPTVLQYLNKFIALAPVAYVADSTSPLVQVAGWLQAGILLHEYDIFVHNKKFAWETEATRIMMEDLCSIALDLCILKVRLLSDTNTKVDNVNRLVVTQGHFPAGTSIQNIVYWQQMYNNGQTFKKYNYGAAKNQQVYGQPTPPEYDMSKITEPVYMFAGSYDELAPLEDTRSLRDELTGVNNLYYKEYPLGHTTFVFGKDVAGYMVDALAILSS